MPVLLFFKSPRGFFNALCHRACQMVKVVIALERAKCRAHISQMDTKVQEDCGLKHWGMLILLSNSASRKDEHKALPKTN